MFLIGREEALRRVHEQLSLHLPVPTLNCAYSWRIAWWLILLEMAAVTFRGHFSTSAFSQTWDSLALQATWLRVTFHMQKPYLNIFTVLLLKLPLPGQITSFCKIKGYWEFHCPSSSRAKLEKGWAVHVLPHQWKPLSCRPISLENKYIIVHIHLTHKVDTKMM